MTEQELQNLINQGEGQTLEFKSSLTLRQEIGETVSAFANTAGGIILIGVSDKGKVVGVEIGRKTLEDLANWVKENTDPRIYPDVKIQEANQKSLIVVAVRENAEKPVFFKDRAFQRVGKTNQRISASKIRELAKQERMRFHWDEEIYKDAVLDDIDEGKVKQFVKEAKVKRNLSINERASSATILRKLGLLRESKLTNAALLLFGKDPQKFIPKQKSDVQGLKAQSL